MNISDTHGPRKQFHAICAFGAAVSATDCNSIKSRSIGIDFAFKSQNEIETAADLPLPDW